MSEQARSILARHVAWARTQVGRTESPAGSNHVRLTINGHDQDLWAYLRPSFQGEPWCAAFQTVGLLQQGVDLRKLFRDGNSFYCPSLEAMAKTRGVWHPVGSGYNPKLGDLVLMHNPGVGYATHVECAAPDSSHYDGYREIGGNTSPGNHGSQNNGGGVWLRDRQASGIRGWIDMETLIDQMIHEGKVTATAGHVAATAQAAKPAASHVGPVIARGWRRTDAPYRVDVGHVATPLSVAALNAALHADAAARDGVKAHAGSSDEQVRVVLEALRRVGLVSGDYAARRIAGTTAQHALDTYRDWVGTPRGWTLADRRGTVGKATLDMLMYDAGINATVVG